MTKEFKYDVRQNVLIKAMDNFPGRIVELLVTGNNTLYNVQYALNGKFEYVKLEEDELSAK